MEGRCCRSYRSVIPNKYASEINIHSTRNVFTGILDLLYSCGPESNGEVNSFLAPFLAKILMVTLRSTFATGALVPSLLGGLTAVLVLPLFIFATGPVSGAHLNPTITIATLFGRLATLPRCILYVGFQTFGGAMAGLLLRASFDTRSVRYPVWTAKNSY